MKSVFLVIGLFLGAMVAAYFLGPLGEDYVAKQQFQSGDEVSQMYFIVKAAIGGTGAVIGGFVGWILGGVLEGKKQGDTEL